MSQKVSMYDDLTIKENITFLVEFMDYQEYKSNKKSHN